MILKDFLISIGFDVNDTEFNQAQRKIDQFASKLSTFGRQFSLFISAPIAAAAAYALKASSEVEQMGMSFEVFLGNADQAKKVMQDLINFAVKTPFRMPGLYQAANMLLAMGTSGDKLIETLHILGNVSRGRQDLLQRIALAYGQTMTAKKLRGQELRQFTEAGVGLVEELSKLTGISEAELASNVGKYNISSDVVLQALKNMTSEGGRYFQLLEKQALTLRGIFANALDAMYFFAAEWGAQITNLFNLKVALQKIVDVANKLLKKFRELDPVQQRLLVVIPLIVAAIGPLLLIFTFLVRTGSLVITTFKMMSGAILGLQAGLMSFLMKIAVLPLLISAALFSLYLVIDDFLMWMKGGESFFGDLFGSFDRFKPQLDAFIEKLRYYYTKVKEDLLNLREYIDKEFIDHLKVSFKGLGDTIYGVIVGDINKAADGLKKAIPSLWKIFSNLVNGIVYILWNGYNEIMDKLADLLYNIVVKSSDMILNVVATMMLLISQGITSIINWVKGGFKFSKDKDGKTKPIFSLDNLKDTFSWLGDKGKGLWEGLSNFSLDNFELTPKGLVYKPGVGFSSPSGNNGMKIENNINLQVPQGTTTEQAQFLEEQVRRLARDEIGREVRAALSANPEAN